MATSDRTPREVIRSGFREPMKVYMTYDGSNRLSTTIEAPTTAAAGDPALLTTYTYVGASTRTEKMKESLTTWSASYDI